MGTKVLAAPWPKEFVVLAQTRRPRRPAMGGEERRSVLSAS